MRIATLTALLLLTTGCGSSYGYNGRRYGSSSEALQAQATMCSAVLDSVNPTDSPVGGSVLVLIPSDLELQKHYFHSSLDPAGIPKQAIEYLITSTVSDLRCRVDCIRKDKLFDQVSLARHDGNPALAALKDNDYILFMDVDGWSIKTRDSQRTLLVSVDKGATDPVSKNRAFLDSLNHQAHAIANR
jgi:hypothetical protein